MQISIGGLGLSWAAASAANASLTIGRWLLLTVSRIMPGATIGWKSQRTFDQGRETSLMLTSVLP